SALLPGLPPATPIDDYRGHLVMAGFIDSHIHYSQSQVIASYGAQLLDWLETYAFAEEQKFADPAHGARMAAFFLDELLRNGTTTAAVYCTSHPCAVEAFFTAAGERNMRMIAGKLLMDRSAPTALLDTAQSGYDDSRALIAAWQGRGRAHYAITPRFAVTSSEAQLEAAGALLGEHQGVYMQTHLAENRREAEAVAKLFPDCESYTAVYDRFGLLGPHSLFGHCIHLEDSERMRLSESGSVAVFCPTSNLFIGSGLFDGARARDARFPLRTALGTDVGGGTSYSMLRTAGEAYKVLQLQGQNLAPLQAFYEMTLGNARALDLDRHIGALEVGIEADLVVLDARATPAMAHRMETVDGDLAEELFVLMTLGDDRSVRATYVAGERLHKADQTS
ncbi:MAG: guanine deaminase, partial [Proteobacteria bacterium]|nr:guanine deaminase [Pseudomonadota bacterium]